MLRLLAGLVLAFSIYAQTAATGPALRIDLGPTTRSAVNHVDANGMALAADGNVVYATNPPTYGCDARLAPSSITDAIEEAMYQRILARLQQEGFAPTKPARKKRK